ncbi:MAG TPA: class I SAM-dependent methyltransferase [Planctomycetaceae bacterium]|nr:class I SAM-dependent methyltransferase [Planctomycetaceae bacterium]
MSQSIAAPEDKVHLRKLTGAAETLLIMLTAKADESRRPDGIIRDPKVLEICDRLGDDLTHLRAGWMTQVGVCVRTEIFDDWMREYLAKYPDATIVNLGAGLDTRFSRLDNGRLRWFDVDFPEPLEIRRLFIPETDRLKMIGCSATDPAWTEQIGRPEHLLIVSEGMTMFLTEDEMRGLVTMIADRFPGCDFIYDALTPFMVKRAGRFEAFRKTSGQWRWGVWTGRELTAWDPRIEFVKEERLHNRHQRRWGWIRWLTKIPRIARAVGTHVTHLRFRAAAK